MKKFILLLITTFLLFSANSFAETIITQDTVIRCVANGFGSIDLRSYQTNNDNSKNTWTALNGAPLSGNQYVALNNAGTFKYKLTFVDIPVGGGMPSMAYDTLTVIIKNKTHKPLSLDGSSQICIGDSVKVFFADSTLLKKPLVWGDGDTAFYIFAKNDADLSPEIQIEDQNLCLWIVRDFKIATFDCNSAIEDGKILTQDSAKVCLPTIQTDLRDFQVNKDVDKNFWKSLDGPTLIDDHIFVPTTEGIFRFELFFAEMILGNPNVILDTLVVDVKNGCITSINTESELNNSISVFPNPTKGTVMISNKNRAFASKKLHIKDVLGNVVKEFAFDENLDGKTIDLSNLVDGCYFISDEQNSQIGRVVLIK
jgi:hypothetical protein